MDDSGKSSRTERALFLSVYQLVYPFRSHSVKETLCLLRNTNESTQITLVILSVDKASYEKLSCDGSSSTKSSSDSVTCPLVTSSRDISCDDVTCYRERYGEKRGYIRSAGEGGTVV